MSSARFAGHRGMTRVPARPVVHLELHSGDLARACAFFADLCGWHPERIEAGRGSYWALDGLGGRLGGGGVVECEAAQPLWLPYVEVGDIHEATEHARGLGASIPLAPREGPLGWRSVVSVPAIGDLALWQPKEPPRRIWPRRAVSVGDR